MSRLFPKMTKCTFRKFGPSGTVEKIDALCVMPLNNANEKIYVFLWFWFVLLAVLSIGHLVLRDDTHITSKIVCPPFCPKLMN